MKISKTLSFALILFCQLLNGQNYQELQKLQEEYNIHNKEERKDRNSFIIEFLKEIMYRLYSFIILALIFFII